MACSTTNYIGLYKAFRVRGDIASGFLGEGMAAVLLGHELSLVLALLLGVFRYGFQ